MHTPGPWIVDRYLPNEVRQPRGSKRRSIKCPPDAQGFYDARLIAAAPELLDALGHMLTSHENCGDHHCPDCVQSAKDARTAINKAKGGKTNGPRTVQDVHV